MLRRQVRRVRVQPRIQVLGSDRNDAAVVSGGSHFRRWLVGDAANENRSGSPGADQRDHRQATSMSRGGRGLNSSTTFCGLSPARNARPSMLWRATFS